jgi:hypothetical protein
MFLKINKCLQYSDVEKNIQDRGQHKKCLNLKTVISQNDIVI